MELISSKNISVYSQDKKEIEAQAISDNGSVYFMDCEQDGYIEFSPCRFSGDVLQEALFYIKDENNKKMMEIFRLIKKHIRKEYKLSQDKDFYIGPGIFQDWIEKKYYFQVLFQYDEICIGKERLRPMFEYLLEVGYQIKTAFARLRDIDTIIWDADSYIIFGENAKLVPDIMEKKYIKYKNGSDCIFVYKMKKNYVCLLDQRIKIDPLSQANQIFDIIRKWENTEG